MLIPSRIWEFIATSMVIILAPGPSVLFIIARALAWGRRTALLTAVGNFSGGFTLSILVALGLGPILQRSDLAYAAVQWGGGSYLVYLGIHAIRHRKVHEDNSPNSQNTLSKIATQPSIRRTIWDGFWVGALNPKALVFFAAVIPQFIDRSRGSVTGQLLLLGACFALLALFSDGSWGLLAGTARHWFATDSTRLTKLRLIGGVAMTLLGLLVLLATLQGSHLRQ